MKFAILKVFNPGSLLAFAADIKIAHSIFALPFAGSALVLFPVPVPSPLQVFLLVSAMVGARSFAMGYNRIADRDIDSVNPRTRQRAIPSGSLKLHQAYFWTVLSALMFIGSAFGLNVVAGYCSLPILGILAFYSHWKRFSWVAHWYLGVCLGLAPIAVCVAMGPFFPLGVVVLGAAIATWTAGFDILYALQDREFDQETKLSSVPARFGVVKSVYVSRACFAVMVFMLVIVGLLTVSGWVYFLGVLVIACFLTYEHYLVRDLLVLGYSRHMNAAFFGTNAYVSIMFFTFVVADKLWQ